MIKQIDIAEEINLPQPDLFVNGYGKTNPSIVKLQEGTLINYRLVNYINDHAINYNTFIDGPHINTRNTLCYYNDSFDLIWQKEIKNNINVNYSTHVIGMEDMRLFLHDTQLKFVCTILSKDHNSRPQIYHGSFGNINTILSDDCLYVYVKQIHHIRSPFNQVIEKNWGPIIIDGHIQILYHPQKNIWATLINNALVNIVNKKILLDNVSDIRGSTPPIKIDGGYIAIIHEVKIYSKDGKRNYFHRFILFDDELKLTKISELFYFNHIGVEFTVSMILLNSDLIVGVGLNDSVIKFYKIPLHLVHEKLENISV
jgi:predicted GH43/DUF377 family glycosyl hydrolase